MDQLTAVADEACKETEQKLSDYYDEYCRRTNLPKKRSHGTFKCTVWKIT